MSANRKKVPVRFTATGNEAYLYRTIESLRAAGITRTLVYFSQPHGSRSVREVGLDELEEIR